MGTPLQLRRDADVALNGHTGAAGELLISTNDWRPRISDGITAGGHKLGMLSDFEPGAWQSPALNLGWINMGGGYQDVSYRIDSSGLVTIRGVMQHASASTDGVIFTLLPGFRPAAREYFACYSAGGLFRVDIYANGDVETSGANQYGSSFSGIQFYID